MAGATTTQEHTTTWQFDPVHTMVEVAVKHMMVVTVKGRFGKVNGSIEFDENEPTEGKVEVTIDAASIDTRDSQRDAHLRSPDFLDVERFPTLTFKSRRIEPADGHYRVVGDLTIRDVTREVILDAEYAGAAKSPWGDLRAGFSAKTVISRKDFGLQWNVPLEAGGWLVGDEVKIYLDVEAIKAS